jgi:hypothetical protein
MRRNKDKHQITAPLDNRKHRNVGVVRSAPGIKQYLTTCQAIDQEYNTLAYPVTICMDCQAAEITDDEASLGTPEIIHKEPNKGTRPVTPDVEQMREEISKDEDQETVLQDKDTIVEENFPTYSLDSQKYMH